MDGLTVPLLTVLGAGLVLMAIVQGVSRRVELFSVRNIYLAGFVIYQVVSPIAALRSGSHMSFRIIDPEGAAQWFTLYAYIFIAIYLWSYHRLGISNWFAAKFSGENLTASDSMLTGLAIGMIAFAVLLRAVGVQIPYMRGVSINVSVAIAAASCAVIGWVWGARRMNPAVLMVAGLVLSVSMVVALTGFYSRRPLVSILAGFSWGAYYRWARHLSFSKLVISTMPLIIATAVIVGAYTAIRSNDRTRVFDAKSTMRSMQGASIGSGTADLLGGQQCGSIALWVMETFPDEIDYKPLFSLRFMAYYFVPRFLWEDKPQPLSKDVATLARLRGVNRSVITLPPGVVGYAGAEGGLYAIIIYAIFFGQFTRFFDELIRRNPTNPFVVLSIGCTTGQFLGLARGDIAIFTNLAVMGFVSTFLMIYIAGLAFGRQRTAPLATPWPQMR